MARRTKTVANFIARRARERALARGMSSLEFERATGLTREDLSREHGRIGRAKHSRVVEVCARLPFPALGDPESIAEFALEFPVLVGAWWSAPDLRAALRLFFASRAMIGEFDRIEFRERGAIAELEYISEITRRDAWSQALNNFAMLARLVRAYDQGGETRFTCRLTSPPIPHPGALEAFFLGKVSFDQPANVLRFPSELLEVPARYNRTVHAVLANRLELELRDLHREDSLATAVEAALREIAAGQRGAPEDAALEAVCARFGITRWTLRRHLEREEVTFRELWNRARAGEARRLLAETSLTLGEISDVLGFSRQGSFTRFFKEAVGMAPLRYRRKLLAQDG